MSSKDKRCISCEISFDEFKGDPNPMRGVPMICEHCEGETCENCTIVLTLDRERMEGFGDFIFDGNRHHVISDAMVPYIFKIFSKYKKVLETTLDEIEEWFKEKKRQGVKDEDVLDYDPPACNLFICKKCYTSWEMDFLSKLEMDYENIRQYMNNNWYSLEAKQAYDLLLRNL